MKRRLFVAGLLAATTAPAIVRAESLMRIVPRGVALVIPPTIWTPLASARIMPCFGAYIGPGIEGLVTFEALRSSGHIDNDYMPFHIDVDQPQGTKWSTLCKLPPEFWKKGSQ